MEEKEKIKISLSSLIIILGIIIIVAICIFLVLIKDRKELNETNTLVNITTDSYKKDDDYDREYLDIDSLLESNKITSLEKTLENTKALKYNNIAVYKEYEITRKYLSNDKKQYQDIINYSELCLKNLSRQDSGALILRDPTGKSVYYAVYNGVIYAISNSTGEFISCDLKEETLTKIEIPFLGEYDFYPVIAFKGNIFIGYNTNGQQEHGFLRYNLEKKEWKKILNIPLINDMYYYNKGFIYLTNNQLIYTDFDGNKKVLYTAQFDTKQYNRYRMEILNDEISIVAEKHETRGKGGVDVILSTNSTNISLEELNNFFKDRK